jgi:hypothetical protein
MNKCATKRKSATEKSILNFLAVSSVSSDSIVKGIIDDIIKMAVKTAEVDDKKTKYLPFGSPRMYTPSPSKRIKGVITGN